jgi:DnaJ-class molecular chaperone
MYDIIMSDSKGYYSRLGLKSDANFDEIKRAYRRLSLETHPDRNGNSEESSNKFKEINEAYEVLSDNQKRKQYDMGGLGGLFGMDENAANINPEDILRDLFGGGGGGLFHGMPTQFETNNSQTHFFHMGGGMPNINIRTALQKPTPILKHIKIPMEAAYAGCNIPLEVDRWIMHGNIKSQETEVLYVKIPPGIDENEIIILREKGNIISDTNKGDVKIFVKIENKTDYTRNGLDLIYCKTISLKEALCGFEFTLKYVDGRNFQINNNQGNIITSGYRKLIPRMGMKRDDNIGNLVIDFTVIFPESLTPEQVTIIKDNL